MNSLELLDKKEQLKNQAEELIKTAEVEARKLNTGEETELTTIQNGVLGDIAPTILDLMGIEKPTVMTCKSLL